MSSSLSISNMLINVKVANYGESSQQQMEREKKMNKKLTPSERNFGGGSKIKDKIQKSGGNTYELEAWAKELGEQINGKQKDPLKEAAGETFLQGKMKVNYCCPRGGWGCIDSDQEIVACWGDGDPHNR